MTQRAIIATHARTHARAHGITARIFGCALSRMIRRLQEHYALRASFLYQEEGRWRVADPA